MAMDALSQALSARRGKSLDQSLLHGASHEIDQHDHQVDGRKGLEAGGAGENAHLGMADGKHSAIDSRVGIDGKATAHGEVAGTNTGPEHGNLPNPAGQHTLDINEGKAPSPAASWHSKTHLDEHISPANEQHAVGVPASQSTGMGEGELHNQIRDHIIGHESSGEYEQLKAMKSPSLGQRAKMSAMKDKYEKK